MGTPIRTILDDLDKSELENQINAKADSDHSHTTTEIGAVSQGTGAGQSANKVHIGWASDSSGLKVTVDNTDLGYIYTSAGGKGVPVTSVNGVTGNVKVKSLYNNDNSGYAYLMAETNGDYILACASNSGINKWAIQNNTAHPTILSYHYYDQTTGNWLGAANIYSTVNKPTAAEIEAIPSTGGTITGEIISSVNNIGYKCDNGTYSMGLRIGSGGTNRGIYDDTNSRWMVYSDNTATTKVGGVQDLAQSCLRNIDCGTAALTAGSSSLTTGTIYVQYE